MPRRLLVVALSCIVTLMTFLPAQAQEATPPERTLTVTGHGSESVPYTDAIFNLGVQADGSTAAEAQAQLRTQLNPLVDRLKQLQVQKLRTTNVQLYPRYNNPVNREPAKVIGFTASSNLSFQVPIAQAGKILDSAVGSGANVVQNLSFSAPDAQLDAARSVALSRAVADAQAQADAVLKSLNLTARQVRSIQVGDTSRPPRPFALAKTLSADASTPIEGGTAQVEADVTLQISY